MGTRTFAQVPPTSATIALNAYIFGYAGHSLVTPHAALKQLWWTDDRIERKVTRNFVVKNIRGEEREFLDRPLAFGEGLTDDTYMEWILARARRLFLVLAEVGKPEQIFGLIDDSLDDDDLPFSLDTIRRLDLSIEPDERLNRKCYDTQFLYLLRQLKRGSHIDYGPNEHIPMEYVHRLPPAVPLQCWDRIHLPNAPDQVFLRRKFIFGSEDPNDPQRSEYVEDIARAKYLRHEHICTVWASYTTGDSGYILSDFVPEHTLGTFIAQRLPYQFMRVSASERPMLVLEWLHCLSDALASLHHRGTCHGAIRPSNIIVDQNNRIAFADVGVLRTFQKGKKAEKKEIAEYAAPEIYTNMTTPRIHTMHAKANSDGSSSSEGSTRSNSMFSASPGSPILSPTSSPILSFPPTPKTRSFRNFSRHLSHPSSTSATSAAPSNVTSPLPPPTSTGRGTSLASIIASATTNITTITPSLPPPTPDEMSPHSFAAPWLETINTTPTKAACSLIPSISFSAQCSPFNHQPQSNSNPSTMAFPPSIPFLRPIHKVPSTSHLPSITPIRSHSSLPTPPLPEAADVFSLGCIYLDVLTWLVKGRLNEFHRFRSSPTPPGLHSLSTASIRSTRSARSFLSYRSVSGSRSTNPSRISSHSTASGAAAASERTDSAYAANIADGKLDLWMSDLRDESLARLEDPKVGRAGDVGNGAVWINGVPEILRLVKDMLAPEPEDRPTAKEVRDRVEEVLVKGCCFERICCRAREWESGIMEMELGNKKGGDMRVEGEEETGVDLDVDPGVGESGREEGMGRFIMRKRIDRAVEHSGGVPIRKRKVSLPWRRK